MYLVGGMFTRQKRGLCSTGVVGRSLLDCVCVYLVGGMFTRQKRGLCSTGVVGRSLLDCVCVSCWRYVH